MAHVRTPFSQEDSEHIFHWLQKNTKARDKVDGSAKDVPPLMGDPIGR